MYNEMLPSNNRVHMYVTLLIAMAVLSVGSADFPSNRGPSPRRRPVASPRFPCIIPAFALFQHRCRSQRPTDLTLGGALVNPAVERCSSMSTGFLAQPACRRETGAPPVRDHPHAHIAALFCLMKISTHPPLKGCRGARIGTNTKILSLFARAIVPACSTGDSAFSYSFATTPGLTVAIFVA